MLTSDDSVKAPKKEMNFAESVHQLVTELSEQDPTMIKWTSDGAAFTVNPSHPGLGDALAKYFQHSKYSSFQRQLNQYGWTKPRSGRYNGTFFNPSFRKDSDIEDVRKITRGGCKKHLRKASVESSSSSENMVPLVRKKALQSRKLPTTLAVSSSKKAQKDDPSTPSPHRRRSRLPLQKRPVNLNFISVPPKTVSPLTTKAIENPSADDMTAVQVLLGMVQKPKEQELTVSLSSSRPSDTTVAIVSSGAATTDKVVTTKSSSGGGARSKGRNFALAVHELVTEAHASNPTMIRWVQDGSAFEIDRSHPNLGKALAKYFQHSKYSSFQRQLNQYGWCKVRNTGKFFNQYFHQDKEKSNFDMIQRKDKKTDSNNNNSLFSTTRGRGTKRVSITSTEQSRSEVEFFSSSTTNNKRRRTSSISEPRLLPVSDEETISSEEGSIQSSHHQHVTLVDLTRPPSNVMAYLPQQQHSHHLHE